MSAFFLLLFAGLVTTQPPEPKLTIFSPSADQPAAGVTEIWIDVDPAPPDYRVLFRVDGREVARFTEPPYQFTVDLGLDNRKHHFEFIVRDAESELTRVERTTPAIRVDEEIDLELRQLYVTVEQRGQRVPGLGADSFDVLDDGEPQEIVTFEGGEAPLEATLLVDASLSMRGEPLQFALAGARNFLEGLHDLDEASLVLFSDRTLARTEHLPADQARHFVIGALQAEGGSAIQDHLYTALSTLDSRQGRRVVVLLSDGIDVHSTLRAEDVRWRMERGQSMVYWIELTESLEDDTVGTVSPWRGVSEHRQERTALIELVEASGGRRIRIDDAQQAPAVFAEILRELREQYVIGYYPTHNDDDGSWHAVKVSVRERGLTVRTRAGYVDVP